jgi:hypothetical protein
MTIDFDRAKLLLDVYHLAQDVPEARGLVQAARMELEAMLKPAPASAPSSMTTPFPIKPSVTLTKEPSNG